MAALVSFILFYFLPTSLASFPYANQSTKKQRGCVSGEQISNVQKFLSNDGEKDYDFDKLDGYDELE